MGSVVANWQANGRVIFKLNIVRKAQYSVAIAQPHVFFLVQ